MSSANDAFERGVRICQWVLGGQPVTTERVCTAFGVSRATAKRDLVRTEQLLPVSVERQDHAGLTARKVLRLMKERRG